ncbi:MAG: phosphatidate cytidylyltransferase [Bacteroidetes bacterium]|nr:phosphatidate cytidylyltransferase [Bacteroidota bacterium]
MTIRILTAVVAIPLMLGSLYLGGWVFNLLMMALSVAGLLEFYNLGTVKGSSPNKVVGVGGGIAVTLLASLFVDPTQPWSVRWLMLMVPALMATSVMTLMIEMWRNKPQALYNVSTTLMGIVYVGLGFASLIYLRQFQLDGTLSIDTTGDLGFRFVAIMFVSVWMCDSMAYFVGMAIGRHKIFPRVSPKKSWEGSIAGMIASIATFGFGAMWFMPSLELHHGLICGLIVGVGGQLGDFAESWLKRDAEVKDSSQLIPGHGGVLDRFDSVLFVAPMLVIYAALLTLVPSLR